MPQRQAPPRSLPVHVDMTACTGAPASSQDPRCPCCHDAWRQADIYQNPWPGGDRSFAEQRMLPPRQVTLPPPASHRQSLARPTDRVAYWQPDPPPKAACGDTPYADIRSWRAASSRKSWIRTRLPEPHPDSQIRTPTLARGTSHGQSTANLVKNGIFGATMRRNPLVDR
jgi:hypothetical protein